MNVGYRNRRVLRVIEALFSFAFSGDKETSTLPLRVEYNEGRGVLVWVDSNIKCFSEITYCTFKSFL